MISLLYTRILNANALCALGITQFQPHNAVLWRHFYAAHIIYQRCCKVQKHSCSPLTPSPHGQCGLRGIQPGYSFFLECNCRMRRLVLVCPYPTHSVYHIHNTLCSCTSYSSGTREIQCVCLNGKVDRIHRCASSSSF